MRVSDLIIAKDRNLVYIEIGKINKIEGNIVTIKILKETVEERSTVSIITLTKMHIYDMYKIIPNSKIGVLLYG